jgi:hypothetical protein
MLYFYPVFKQNLESKCLISWVSNFRGFRVIANSNYQLRHVRSSACNSAPTGRIFKNHDISVGRAVA